MSVRIGGDATHPITNPADLDISVVTRDQTQSPPLPATESAPDAEKAPSPDAGSIQGFDRANVQQKLNQALIDELVRKAGGAGLDEADTERLGKILARVPPADFKRASSKTLSTPAIATAPCVPSWRLSRSAWPTPIALLPKSTAIW